jgi:prepilin-type N-terminal cleavage/methylation domain-containing protein
MTVRAQRGFSLIDIMVVMAIVGIVAAVAIPMTASSLGGFQFQGDGETLACRWSS